MSSASSKYKNLVYLLLLVSGVFTLALMQDFLHATLRDYSFYWSEALLFNSFWMLFLLLLWLRGTWLKWVIRFFPHSYCNLMISVVMIVIHLVLFAFILFLVSWLFLNQTYGFEWALRYAVSDMLHFAVGGYALIGLLDWQSNYLAESESSPKQSLPRALRATIAVKSKRGTLYLAAEEIAMLRSASPYVELHAKGKKYLEATTLRALSEILDPTQFVRIHKSCIVNLSFILEQNSRGNGDYDLVLQTGQVVRLSRNYAAKFKHRMEAHQLSPG